MKAFNETIRQINCTKLHPWERDCAFIRLREYVRYSYGIVAKRYSSWLRAEGMGVKEFVDYVLWKCVKKYDHTYGILQFLTGFWVAIGNEFKMYLRQKSLALKNGILMVPTSSDILKFTASTKETFRNLEGEIFRRLSPIQKRVFGLRISGYKKWEIQKKLYLQRHELDPILKQIKMAARKVATRATMEV